MGESEQKSIFLPFGMLSYAYGKWGGEGGGNSVLFSFIQPLTNQESSVSTSSREESA